MCGIVGAIAERNIVPLLFEGLQRLEYRGYDSSGIAILDDDCKIKRIRALGKVKALSDKIQETTNKNIPFTSQIGIAHTRWATHGSPAEHNAHPHVCNNQICIVHNGIIENYSALKIAQIAKGYNFTSETDTEVIAHELHKSLQTSSSLIDTVRNAIQKFTGSYSIGMIMPSYPDTLIAVRQGSPLVIGVGIGEYFIASDVSALLPVTQKFVFLEDGDIAEITREGFKIYDVSGNLVTREIKQSNLSASSVELGEHRHYMHKEIFEQPQAIIDTLEGRVSYEEVYSAIFGNQAEELLCSIEQVQIVACGTSYHAGMVARYWFEDIIGMPCQTEVASEYRYRNPIIKDNTLFVTISQSGETADTLFTLQQINKLKKYKKIVTLTICNVAESSLTRESDLTFLAHAGPEIGVASTKAFTTQLVSLALLLITIGKIKQTLSSVREENIVQGLHKLPNLVKNVLEHELKIKTIAETFADKHNALFLGRGTMYPIAMEGALKLKEISYIHAEAYPAGELKHGPLALIDEHVPVIAIAPLDDLLEKLKANLQEVSARGGKMIVFEDEDSNVKSEKNFNVIKVTSNVGRITAPITFNIALQLLSYHVALIKGTDLDQPRNLAKSVTVE